MMVLRGGWPVAVENHLLNNQHLTPPEPQRELYVLRGSSLDTSELVQSEESKPINEGTYLKALSWTWAARCYGLKAFPHNSYVEALIPQMTVLGAGAFRR